MNVLRFVAVALFSVIFTTMGLVWFHSALEKNTPTVEQAVHRAMEKCGSAPVAEYHYTVRDGPSWVCGK